MSHMKAKFETSASSHGRKRVGIPKPKMPSAPAKLPHITKLMALAIRLEHLLATGQVKDQAEIARSAGYTQLDQNLERAAELTIVPRDEIITMYQTLRPGRSDFVQLMNLADRLEQHYQAVICAQFVREAAAVYQERGMLRHPDAL
jgi:propanediol dehydratase small subunit